MKRNRIRNVPLLLRHRWYRRRTIVSVFAYLGALATLLEVASRTVNDPLASYLDSLWVTGGLALVGTAIVLVATLPSDRYYFTHPSFGAHIGIELGDLLSAPDDLVVLTANRHFDSVPVDRNRGGAGEPVGVQSLIAQLGRRWFPDGDGYDISRMIQASGTELGVEHRVGTFVDLTGPTGERRILIAVSSRDEVSQSTVLIDDIWNALSRLWDHARRTGAQSVALPVVGSGLARAEVGPNPLLMLLITSYVTAAMEKPICPIRILLRPDAFDLGAFELAQSYCVSLGFKSAAEAPRVTVPGQRTSAKR
jgi:hypothetical protein